MKVLVAYATKHGATKGIAERVAETLRADGLDVSLEQAADVRNVASFDAFVVGSAAYMYHWLGEATDFVRSNDKILSTRPTWLFASGPIGTDLVDKQGRDVLEASRPKEFAELDEKIHPLDEHVFFGAYDPEAPPIGLAERIGALFIRSGVVKEELPAGDFRDWPKIEEWAHSIAGALLKTAVGASA